MSHFGTLNGFFSRLHVLGFDYTFRRSGTGFGKLCWAFDDGWGGLSLRGDYRRRLNRRGAHFWWSFHRLNSLHRLDVSFDALFLWFGLDMLHDRVNRRFNAALHGRRLGGKLSHWFWWRCLLRGF